MIWLGQTVRSTRVGHRLNLSPFAGTVRAAYVGKCSMNTMSRCFVAYWEIELKPSGQVSRRRPHVGYYTPRGLSE
jgi:hypothetical protein